MREAGAHAGCIPGVRVDRRTALDGGDGAQLPTANDAIQDGILVRKRLALAEWKIVEDRRYEAVRNVEAGIAVVARTAALILQREVRTGSADGAVVIERLRPRVAEHGRKARAKALCQLRREGIV